MKVKELIQKLEKYNPEDKVLTTYSGLEICNLVIRHGSYSVLNQAFYPDALLQDIKNNPSDLQSAIFLCPKKIK